MRNSSIDRGVSLKTCFCGYTLKGDALAFTYNIMNGNKARFPQRRSRVGLTVNKYSNKYHTYLCEL